MISILNYIIRRDSIRRGGVKIPNNINIMKNVKSNKRMLMTIKTKNRKAHPNTF